MCQADVWSYLKKQRLLGVDDWYNASDISKALGISYKSARRSLVLLFKSGFLEATNFFMGDLIIEFNFFRARIDKLDE